MIKQFYFKHVYLARHFFAPSLNVYLTHRILSGATTLGQSRLGRNGKEGTLCIPQSSGINGALQSDCLVSYPGYLLGKSYPSVEMQTVYSTTSVDWAIFLINDHFSYTQLYGIKYYYLIQIIFPQLYSIKYSF